MLTEYIVTKNDVVSLHERVNHGRKTGWLGQTPTIARPRGTSECLAHSGTKHSVNDQKDRLSTGSRLESLSAGLKIRSVARSCMGPVGHAREVSEAVSSFRSPDSILA